MQQNRLEQEKITTLFLKYTIPSVAGMVFLGINTIIDGFFVGHYIGVEGLAAVTLAMPFLSISIAVGVVIGIGAQSLIGRQLGEGNSRAVADTFKTAVCLMLGVMGLLAAGAVGFTKPIAALLGASESLLMPAATYIHYTGWFLPCLGVMFVLDYVLKVMGKPLYSMQVLTTAVLSHMTCNYLFIVQAGWGIRGAALAMGVGYSVALLLALLPFVLGKTAVNFRQGRVSKALAYQIFATGSPEGLTEIGTGVTTFLFNLTLLRYVGEMGIAAFTAISYLSFMANNILLGLADGVGAIFSYNYGRGSMERVKQALKLAALAAFLIGVGMFAVISTFAGDIIVLFLDAKHEQVFSFAVYGAELYAFAFLVNGLNIVASGYFTAICQPRNAIVIAVSKGMAGIGVCLLLLPLIWGTAGIWLTVPVAELGTLFLSALFIYNHGKEHLQRDLR